MCLEKQKGSGPRLYNWGWKAGFYWEMEGNEGKQVSKSVHKSQKVRPQLPIGLDQGKEPQHLGKSHSIPLSEEVLTTKIWIKSRSKVKLGKEARLGDGSAKKGSRGLLDPRGQTGGIEGQGTYLACGVPHISELENLLRFCSPGTSGC